MKSEKRFIAVMSPFEEDHDALWNILCYSPWRTLHCRTSREAQKVLGEAALILCDQGLADGYWRDLLGQLATMPNPPALIVTSRIADAALWGEVINLGGADVLTKPFRVKEVLQAVTSACARQRAA